MTELERLAGIGQTNATRLRNEGYETAEDVMDEDVRELLAIDGIGEGIIKKLKIKDERKLKGLRIPREWRDELKSIVQDTPYTLSDALNCLLPEDLESNRMERPNDSFVSMYVEQEVHNNVNSLAGDNITALDILEKYVGDLSSDELHDKIENELTRMEEDNE